MRQVLYNSVQCYHESECSQLNLLHMRRTRWPCKYFASFTMLLIHKIVTLFSLAAAPGLTALMIAATRNHPTVIRYLVQHGGANVTYAHKFAGTTALHMAAELGHTEAVEALCSVGANIRALTSTGSTPLHTAAHAGAGRPVVHSLVRVCGAEVDALMNEDTTPLYLAAQFGFVETIKVGETAIVSC